MKEGNSVLCKEDIVNGTRGRLRGAHVYPITCTCKINRDAEPPTLTLTLTGISQYGDFEYTPDGTVMRENTGIVQGKLHSNETFTKLSKSSFNTTEASSGFDLSHAKHVPKMDPKVSKAKAKVAQVKSTKRSQVQNTLCEKFLRTGNLHRHRETMPCTSKKLQNSN